MADNFDYQQALRENIAPLQAIGDFQRRLGEERMRDSLAMEAEKGRQLVDLAKLQMLRRNQLEDAARSRKEKLEDMSIEQQNMLDRLKAQYEAMGKAYFDKADQREKEALLRELGVVKGEDESFDETYQRGIKAYAESTKGLQNELDSMQDQLEKLDTDAGKSAEAWAQKKAAEDANVLATIKANAPDAYATYSAKKDPADIAAIVNNLMKAGRTDKANAVATAFSDAKANAEKAFPSSTEALTLIDKRKTLQKQIERHDMELARRYNGKFATQLGQYLVTPKTDAAKSDPLKDFNGFDTLGEVDGQGDVQGSPFDDTGDAAGPPVSQRGPGANPSTGTSQPPPGGKTPYAYLRELRASGAGSAYRNKIDEAVNSAIAQRLGVQPEYLGSSVIQRRTPADIIAEAIAGKGKDAATAELKKKVNALSPDQWNVIALQAFRGMDEHPYGWMGGAPAEFNAARRGALSKEAYLAAMGQNKPVEKPAIPALPQNPTSLDDFDPYHLDNAKRMFGVDNLDISPMEERQMRAMAKFDGMTDQDIANLQNRVVQGDMQAAMTVYQYLRRVRQMQQ